MLKHLTTISKADFIVVIYANFTQSGIWILWYCI